MATPTRLGSRAILHIDMNAFFAAVEQRDFPELRHKPVGVTNGEVGTTLITCSYEARTFGVKTGMRVYQARRLCRGLIQRPARPKVYAAISTRIMRALHDISGELPCSIGVAGTKFNTKIASDLKKPNGLTVIPPWEARSRLAEVPMKKLCDLGPNIAEFLSLYGARTCGDVARLPMTVLARRYGVTAKYLWLACQGKDKDPVVPEVAPPQLIGQWFMLPYGTPDGRRLFGLANSSTAGGAVKP